MEEKLTFTIIGEDGNEIECEALFTFDSEETGNSYMVYTDNSIDEDGNVKVYAAIYNPEDGEEGILKPIESDKEWAIVETILNEIQDDFEEEDEYEH